VKMLRIFDSTGSVELLWWGSRFLLGVLGFLGGDSPLPESEEVVVVSPGTERVA